MISKLYLRITLLVCVVLLPLVVYVSNHLPTSEQQMHFLDSVTRLPLVTEKQGETVIEAGKHDEPEIEGLILDDCTIVNPMNRGFIDLRGLSSLGNEGRPIGWGAKGYDSGVNFTIGVCSSPMKKVHDKSEIQDGLNSSLIGAFYRDPKTSQYVSIGEYSTTPKFRGRKLTLTYEHGSFCNIKDENGDRLRKSTILTLTCDREMHSKASVSYIGNSNDCSYMFEMRSHHVCPTAAKGNNLAAVWICLFIVLAAVGGISSGNILYRHLKKTSKVGL